jgi:hypothetical protein
MSIKILFLIAFAFFAGKCYRSTAAIWQIGYLLTVFLGGILFYYAPIVYAGVSILATCVVAGLFALAGSVKEHKTNSEFKINFILQTLFFWPVNLYDLIYLGLRTKPKNKNV